MFIQGYILICNIQQSNFYKSGKYWFCRW